MHFHGNTRNGWQKEFIKIPLVGDFKIFKNKIVGVHPGGARI